MRDLSALAALGASSDEIDAVVAMLAYREREELAAEDASAAPTAGVLSAGASAQASAAAARVSVAAFKLIVDYETGGRAFYENVIKSRPIWPKASSGVTIGFGYDLGYVAKDEYRSDWAALIPTLSAAQRSALEACVGFHSGKDPESKLQQLVASVRDVVVPWEPSAAVFKATTLPKFALLTDNALPNCDLVNEDCFGVLVSLTFNRGASYSKLKDRYREMRAIKAAMEARQFAEIPKQLKAMIRIWVGTQVESGLRRRRNDEAELFLSGLAAPPVAVAPSGFEAVASSAPLAATAESVDGPSDEDFWTETTEDDVAAAAIDGFTVGIRASGATWAADSVQPDYAHLGDGLTHGIPFELTTADLALLARLNDFDVGALGDDTPVLFGLRGAGIVKDHASGGIVLVDQRPDHTLPRCTIGVWNRKTNTVAVFPGSTVPNQEAVAKFKNDGSAGNLLSTGLYGYICGPHITSKTYPGCFLLRMSDMSKRVVIVRRSRNNLSYDLADIVDRCPPGDNIHPTFFSTPSGFSSLGCQTVVGTFKNGAHSGPWAEFRQAAGLTDVDGVPKKPFLYMLLTGAEARIASRLRLDGLAADSVALRRLRRLRSGSTGDAARRLQEQLNLPDPDGRLGPFTAESLHKFQANRPGASGSDGIFTPDLDTALGWQVFGSVGV